MELMEALILFALYSKRKGAQVDDLGLDWKKVVLDIAKGLKYLHNYQRESILHNVR